jgi:hypothetical protein
LVRLEKLFLGYDSDSNKFVGPVPTSLSKLTNLRALGLNVATLTGPLPDLSQLMYLEICYFTPSLMCRVPGFGPIIPCDYADLPICPPEKLADCVILSDWLPDTFEAYNCCDTAEINCDNDRIITLDLSFATTGLKLMGNIPNSLGGLSMLRKIFLQDNYLEGNLPVVFALIPSLQIIDISNNLLSGVIPFDPLFVIVGVDSNADLSLPGESAPAPTESTLSVPEIENGDTGVALVAGISMVAFVLFIFLASAIIMSKLKARRKQGKETDIELRLIPKYTSPNKKIRLMSKLASGGFGVVWKAKYQGNNVAVKLIRMDRFEGKENDGDAQTKMLKMVIDEAAIMELMVHDRIVRFVYFEIESFGIVLQYLPLGSLDAYIKKSKGVMPWNDRHRMMVDICKGMEFLHSPVYDGGAKKQVLFHQDLKSGNVLMSMEGSPPVLRGKISDFGLSCMFFHSHKRI